MDLSTTLVVPVERDHDQRQESNGQLSQQQSSVDASFAPAVGTGSQMSNEESSINISNASHAGSYKTSEIHMLAPPSNNQMNNCFTAKPQGPGYQTSKLLSPPRSQRSTPTPSPTSSPSPPFQSTPSNLIDLNSIVSYSQLIQRRDEVIRALRHRSGELNHSSYMLSRSFGLSSTRSSPCWEGTR
ncbi:expressed protein [Phakopsora pachyrhizi]|uniref:Expressed protein n=1 Tax=Phakopsora pachyrhizi TaxID=170000 RepID=A0AAV0B6F0_PHAPC|nr:expressed protein [Phakopsora pachyrhizi]